MKIKRIKPLLNHIVTTANIYTSVQDDIIEEGKCEGNFKEYQTVVAVGPNCTTVKPGDLVVINPKAYAIPRHKSREDSLTGLMTNDEVYMEIQFPIIDLDGIPHLFLYDRDIDFIIEEWDEEDTLEKEATIIE